MDDIKLYSSNGFHSQLTSVLYKESLKIVHHNKQHYSKIVLTFGSHLRAQALWVLIKIDRRLKHNYKFILKNAFSEPSPQVLNLHAPQIWLLLHFPGKIAIDYQMDLCFRWIPSLVVTFVTKKSERKHCDIVDIVECLSKSDDRCFVFIEQKPNK